LPVGAYGVVVDGEPVALVERKSLQDLAKGLTDGSLAVQMAALEAVRRALPDARSGQVVFVSHCLLSENVRYLGGAARPAAIDEIVDACREIRAGICQMPCPEQAAWGGVLKRRLLPVYGAAGTVRHRLRGPLARLFLAWTALVHRRLARAVAGQIADYRGAGLEVVGAVGVGASPSCGVTWSAS
jgi:uncharacterized protein YbbK (DUF523 family)